MHNLSRQEIIFGLIGLLVCTFFAYLDFNISNDIATSIAYVSLLGFGLLARSRRLTICFGLLGILATFFGYYYPVNEFTQIDFTNRQLVVIAILTITITSHIFMIRQEEFDASLYRIAITDELTGIANRRALVEELEKRITEAVRYKKELSLLMFDIDGFKDINDSYGHLIGDAILQRLTRVCQNWLRTTDIIGRYGGEEFLAICPNTSLEGAKTLAERIRLAIEQSDFTYKNTKISVTVSIGVTELTNHIYDLLSNRNEVEILHDMIDAADSAMYIAKRKGKNSVIAYEPEKNPGYHQQAV